MNYTQKERTETVHKGTRSAPFPCDTLGPACDTGWCQRDTRRVNTRVGTENGSDTRVIFFWTFGLQNAAF